MEDWQEHFLSRKVALDNHHCSEIGLAFDKWALGDLEHQHGLFSSTLGQHRRRIVTFIDISVVNWFVVKFVSSIQLRVRVKVDLDLTLARCRVIELDYISSKLLISR